MILPLFFFEKIKIGHAVYAPLDEGKFKVLILRANHSRMVPGHNHNIIRPYYHQRTYFLSFFFENLKIGHGVYVPPYKGKIKVGNFRAN